jgi:hypothetical protein
MPIYMYIFIVYTGDCHTWWLCSCKSLYVSKVCKVGNRQCACGFYELYTMIGLNL